MGRFFFSTCNAHATSGISRAATLIASAAVLLAAVAIAPAAAALPISEWTYTGVYEGDAFVHAVDGMTIVAYPGSTNPEMITVVARSLDGEQAELWSADSVCSLSVFGIMSAADDAAIIVACTSAVVALDQRNGSVLWTAEFDGISLQGPSSAATQPLPTMVAIAGGRIVVPVYTGSNNGGNTGLSLLGVVTPPAQRGPTAIATVAADVPCLDTMTSLVGGGAAHTIVVVCTPAANGGAAATMKGFSTARGRLDLQWSWGAPMQAAITVDPTTTSSGADLLAMVYQSPYAFTNSFTEWYRVDAAAGTVANITDLRGEAAYVPYSNDQTLYISGAGEGSFAFWAVGSVSFATLGGSGAESYLDFTAATQYVGQYPQYAALQGLVGVPLPNNARHFAGITSNVNNNNLYTQAYDRNGSTLLHALAENIYSPGGGVFVAFCPESLRVVVGGASQVSGYIATDGTSPYTLSFASTDVATSATVSGLTAAIATSVGNAFAFDAVPGSSWKYEPEGSNGPTAAATYSGVTYVAGVYRVYAYGPQGTQLWVSKSLFGSEWAAAIAVVGDTVVVRMPSRVIAVDSVTGSLLYDYRWQSGSGAACTAPQNNMQWTPGTPVGTAAPSVLVWSQYSQGGGATCAYLVRADQKVVALPILTPSTVVAAPNNGNFIVTDGTTMAEVDGWTGEVRWSSTPANTQINTVTSGDNVVYTTGYSQNTQTTVLHCISRVDGSLQWVMDGVDHPQVVTVFAVATDNAIVSLNIGTGGTNDLAMVGTARVDNVTFWTVNWRKSHYVPYNGPGAVLVAQGVLVVFSLYGPDGYNCEYYCMNGFEVATGQALWGVLNSYPSSCGVPLLPLLPAPARGALITCNQAQTYALDVFSGNRIFVATVIGSTPLALSGDVLVLKSTQSDGGFISGVAVPTGPLVAFMANASKSLPMPPPFKPVVGPPTPPPVPTPAPVPPMPTVVPPTPGAEVEWTFNSPGGNGIRGSTEAIDGVYLAADSSQLYFVSELNGSTLRTLPLPNDCNDEAPDSVVAALPLLFVVTCTSSHIGFSPNGTQLYQVFPAGGVSTFPPVPLPESVVAIYTAGQRLVYLAANGTQLPVNLALPATASSYMFPTANKMPARNGIIVYGGLTVGVVYPNGTVAYRVVLDSSTYNQFVDVLLMPDMSACVAIEDQSSALVLIRLTPTGRVAYALTGYTAPQLDYNEPTGVLTTGVINNKTIVAYASPQATSVLAIDFVAGTSLWRYNANDNLQTLVGAAFTSSCVFVLGQTQSTLAACIDANSGNARFSAQFSTQVQQGGAVTASEDPITGDVTFVGNKLIGMIRADNTVGWSYVNSNVNYYAHFVGTTVTDPGTASARILAYTAGNGYLSVGYTMIRAAAVESDTSYFPSPSLNFGQRAFAVVPQSGSNTNNVSLAIMDGDLLFLGCAQTGTSLWRVGLSGSPTSSQFTFNAQSVFYVQGRVAAIRSNGVFFFNATSGEPLAAASSASLMALCSPNTNTNGMSGWALHDGRWLLVSNGQCLYVFDGTTPRSATIVGGIGAEPFWSGARLIVTNQAGAIVALNPATAAVEWSAPPPLNSGTINTNNDVVSASASGGTSTVYSVGTGNCISAHFEPTGVEVWQACFPSLGFTYYYGVTTPCVANETLLLVNGAQGLFAIDTRPETNNANRLVWQLPINENNNAGGTTTTQPPQYSNGVAVTVVQGTLVGVNASNGVQLWMHQHDNECASFTLSGRYAVIGFGDGLAVYDVETGATVPHSGTPTVIDGLVILPPSTKGELRVGYGSYGNGNYYIAAASIPKANRAGPPAPPLPANGTLPPGFTPAEPHPTQVAPRYSYNMVPPVGAVDWSWPDLTNEQSNASPLAALLLTPHVMLFRVANALLAADTRTQASLWNASLPQSCQANLRFAQDLGGGTISVVCGAGVPFFFAANGQRTQGPPLLPGVDASGGSETFYHSAAVVLPNAKKGAVGFAASVWNNQQGEYVYSYGVALYGPGSTTPSNYSCSATGTNADVPPTLGMYTDMAGADNLIITCADHSVTWVDGASGAVLGTLPAANQTVAAATTTDGRFTALLGSSNLSPSQIAIVDSETRRVVAAFAIDPPLTSRVFQLANGRTANELTLVTVNHAALTVSGFPLNLQQSGSTVKAAWSTKPFGTQQPYAVQPMTTYTTDAAIVVTSQAGTAYVQTTSGTVLGVAATPPTANLVPTVLTAAQLVVFQIDTGSVVQRLTDGATLAHGPPSTILAPVYSTTSNCMAVTGSTAGSVFTCFDLAAGGWLRRASPLPSPGTVAYGLAGDGSTVYVTSLSDTTAINVSDGSLLYSRGFPGSAVSGGVVLIGDYTAAFTSSGAVWLFATATGTLEHTLEMSLCKQAPTSVSQYNVKVGRRLFVAGRSGCVFMLDVTDTATPKVSTVIDSPASQNNNNNNGNTVFSGTPIFAGSRHVYWLNNPFGQLAAVDATTGAPVWTIDVPEGAVYHSVVEYGVFVCVVAGTHTVNIHRAVDGVLVKTVSISEAALYGTATAFNGRLWLPTLTGAASFAADPTVNDVSYVTAFQPQSSGSSSRTFGTIKISLDGVAVVAATSNSAGIDTVSGAVLWSTAMTPIDQAANHRPDFTIQGDLVAGGVGGNGFSVLQLRTGRLLKFWSFPKYSSGTLTYDDPVLVGTSGIAIFANYFNMVAGLPIGSASASPIPTATAPSNSNVPTAAAPTPAPTNAAGGAALGCIRRIDVETTRLQTCVSSTVIAPLYQARASSNAALDCARGAPAFASCVADYAATMADCGAGIAYLNDVITSINATGQPLALCGRAGACSTAAGEQAFCTALRVPTWAAAPAPLPASGLPGIPTFTTAAATTPAPPTTTAPPPTTLAPTTTTAAPTTTAPPTPLPALSEVLQLRLLAGASVPSEGRLAAELQQALSLSSAPMIRVLGVQQLPRAALASSATVLFAFAGPDAATLAQRTIALPATTLASALHASSIAPVAPPPPPTTSSGAPTPPAPTTTSVSPPPSTTTTTTTGTTTPGSTSTGAPPASTTGAPPTSSTAAPTTTPPATPAPTSQLLALVLEAGASVPTASQLAAELQAALGLSLMPAVTVVGLEHGDTILFIFAGAGADTLARSYLALPASTLQRELHATKAAPATGASSPTGGNGKGATPAWAVAVVIVMGVGLFIVVAVAVVKRKALFGTPVAMSTDEGPSHSIQGAGVGGGAPAATTGGDDYTRYEDMA